MANADNAETDLLPTLSKVFLLNVLFNLFKMLVLIVFIMVPPKG